MGGKMPNIKIKLAKPIEGHDVKITEIEMREPNGRDFFELGEPIAWAQNKAGLAFTADKEEVILAYAERLLVGVDPLLLGQLSLKDAIAVRNAVVDFFVAARAKE
jgi:hypothetical protein